MDIMVTHNKRIIPTFLVAAITFLLVIFFMNVPKIKATETQDTEFRAVWISRFIGETSNFSTEAAFKDEMNEILDIMEFYNLNVMIFHVRTHNNALYKSDLNPVASWWSNVNFAVFDPLEWLIDACHSRGIEFHAWLNPYRVSSTYYGESLPVANPASNASNLLTYNSTTILNPGLPAVREFIIDTCMELIENYNIDAIHFDDYFYTNLGANGALTGSPTILNEPDQATFLAYPGSYNTSSAYDKADWRREQINIFIEDLSNTMRTYNEENNRFVQLGISPTGIYKNGNGVVTYDSEGKPVTTGSLTNGQTHYSSYLFCDSLQWVVEEWIDYIIPQSYWASDHLVAGFANVMGWWDKVVKNTNVNLYSGIGLYFANSENNTYSWKTNSSEFENQLNLLYSYDNVYGASVYSFKFLKDAYNNVATMATQQVNNVKNNVWTSKAILPEVRSMMPVTLGTVKNLTFDDGVLSWNRLANVKFYYVYRSLNPVTFDASEVVAVVGSTDAQTVSWNEEEAGNFYYGIRALSHTNTLGTPTIPQAGQLSLTFTARFDFDNSSVAATFSALPYASRLSLAEEVSQIEGYSFVCWVVNGFLRVDLPIDHQFIMTKNTAIEAIFSQDDEHAVVFIDANGQVLDIQYVLTNHNATDIVEGLPSKPGYKISQTKWSASITNITNDTIAVLQYEPDSLTSLSLQVNGGSGTGSYQFNDIVTIVATPNPGEVFHYWEANDVIVSYDATYQFTLLEEKEITAVYGESSIEKEALIGASNPLLLREGFLSYLGQFSFPDTYTLIEYGLLTANELKNLEFGDDTILRYQSSRYNNLTNEFLMSLSGPHVVARPYLVLENSNSEIIIFYGNHIYQADYYSVLVDALEGLVEGKTAQLPKNDANPTTFDTFLTNHGFSGYTLTHGSDNVLFFGYNAYIALRAMEQGETVLPWQVVQPYSGESKLFNSGVNLAGTQIAGVSPRGSGVMYHNSNDTDVVVSSKDLYGYQHESSAYGYNQFGVLRINQAGEIVNNYAGATLAAGTTITLNPGDYLLTLFEADRFALGGAANAYQQGASFQTGQMVTINYYSSLVYSGE